MAAGKRVGLIGVGLMGYGIGKNIVTKGHSLKVLAHKNREPVEKLLKLGATEGKSPREIAAESDVVILCVTGSPQVEEVVYREDGLLGIVIEGGSRFRVARTRVRSDGLVRGDAELWPEEAAQPVPVEFALLQSILERLVETMAPLWRHAPRERYDDAGWLGFRLSEL